MTSAICGFAALQLTGKVQSGIKCVIVASAIRAEQGPCEPIKGCMREIREGTDSLTDFEI